MGIQAKCGQVLAEEIENPIDGHQREHHGKHLEDQERGERRGSELEMEPRKRIGRCSGEEEDAYRGNRGYLHRVPEPK